MDLAYKAVCAGRVDAVTVCWRRLRADKVVTLLDGKDKERVARVDPVGSEPLKERAERLVVALKLDRASRYKRGRENPH